MWLSTTLEQKLEEARLACEKIQRKLRGRALASWLLPERYNYFHEGLEYLLAQLDEIIGLIATSQTPLRRTETLSRSLMEDGLGAQEISLIQTTSNQGAIVRELNNIWRNDERKMARIENSLREFNQSLRELRRAREQLYAKWLMDVVGFPASDGLPQTLSPWLLKEFGQLRRVSASLCSIHPRI
jgi:hypothetical protein